MAFIGKVRVKNENTVIPRSFQVMGGGEGPSSYVTGNMKKTITQC